MSIQINKRSFSTNKQQSLLTAAFEVLVQKLGPQKTSQIWQVIAPLRGNYASDRQKLFKGKSVDSLYKEAKKFNRK